MSEPPLSPISPWWVVPDRLAGLRKPTPPELAVLSKDHGIHALVSLLSDSSNLDLYQTHAIPHIWVPIQGGTAPSLDQLSQIKTFVDSQHALGQGVAIHCSSGRRRTGTVLAALLIQQGDSYSKALNTVLKANPAVELRDPQISFLQSLANGSAKENTSV
ncbi:MAG: dual specificity protein phosphatase family protein [Cyanobacteria bacterium P01_D01_bin.2]